MIHITSNINFNLGIGMNAGQGSSGAVISKSTDIFVPKPDGQDRSGRTLGQRSW
jgi:hypothetical protein